MKVVLGTKRKYKGFGPKRGIIECFVYVPVLKTLQTLLNNESVLSEVNQKRLIKFFNSAG